MSDYRNSVYDTSPSYLGTGVTLAALGGIGYGGFKAIRDREGFMKSANKTLDWAFPKSLRDFTPNEASVKRFNEAAIGAGRDRLLNEKVMKYQRNKKGPISINEDLAKGFSSSITTAAIDSTRYAETEFTNFSKIKNLLDENIGGKAKEAVTSLIQKTGATSTRWNGTTFVMENSEGKVKIPFAHRDTATGSFIQRDGKALFSAAAKHEHVIDRQAGKLGDILIQGHNEALIDMLGSSDLQLKYAKLSPTFKSSVEKELLKVTKALKSVSIEEATQRVIDSKGHMWLIDKAVEGFSGSTKDWLTVSSDKMMVHNSNAVKIGGAHIEELEEFMPGATGGFYSMSSANINGIEDQVKTGANRVAFIEHDLNPATQKYVLNANGERVDVRSNRLTEKFSTLTSTGSSVQAANNTYYAGEFHGSPTVEGHKSLTSFEHVEERRRTFMSKVWGVDESFYLRKGTNVRTKTPVTDKVHVPITKGLVDGDELYEKSFVDLVSKTGKKVSSVPMADVISGTDAVRLHAEAGGHINYRRGTVSGLVRSVTKSDADGNLLVDNTTTPVKFRTDGYMESKQILETIESSKQTAKKIAENSLGGKLASYQVVSTSEADATKLIVSGTKTRSTAAYFDPEATEGANAAAADAWKKLTGNELPATASSTLFEKMNPIVSVGSTGKSIDVVGQKGAAEHLQQVQDEILGLFHGFAQQGVKITNVQSDSFTRAYNSILKDKKSRGDFMTGNPFRAPERDTGKLAEQLMTSQLVRDSLSDAWMNNSASEINIGLVSPQRSAEISTMLTQRPSDRVHTAPSNAVLDSRRKIDPIMSFLDPAENEALSQGAGNTNIAKLSLRRDAYLLQSRPELANEILKNSSNDTVLVSLQQQLFEQSLTGELDPKLVEKYKKYASDSGYSKNQIDNTFRQYDNPSMSLEEIMEDSRDYAGISEIGDLRSPYKANYSFMSEENDLGKFFSGGKFVPGGTAMGGVTQLENGVMTFKEQVATMFQTRIMPMMENGSISTRDDAKLLDSVTDVVDLMMENSNVRINNAYYPRHQAQDVSAIKHDVLAGLQGKYEKSLIDPTTSLMTDAEKAYRTKFANTSIISEDILRDAVRTDLTSIVDKSAVLRNNDVSQVLADKGGTSRFYAKHSAHIEAIKGMEIAEQVTSIEKLTGKLVEEQIDLARQIHELTFGGGANTKSLAFLQKHDPTGYEQRMQELGGKLDDGFSALLVRDPFITTGAAVNQRMLVDHSGILAGKAISTGYDAALALGTDWDGDKWKAVPSFSDEGKVMTDKYVGTVQESAVRHKIQAKKNYAKSFGLNDLSADGIAKKLMGFTGPEDALKFAEFINKDLPVLTVLSSTIQHGMVGAANVKQFGVQNVYEERINKLQLGERDLQEAMTWAGTLPSTITEQELISAKHVQKLLSEKVAAKGGGAGIEQMFNIIGDITNKELMDTMVRGGGHVPVVAMYAGANAHNTTGAQAEYRESIDFMNASHNLHYNMAEVKDDEMVRKLYAAQQHQSYYNELNPEQEAGVEDLLINYRKNIAQANELAAQGNDLYQPFASRTSGQGVYNGEIVQDIAAGLKKNTSFNPRAIFGKIQKLTSQRIDGDFSLQNESHVEEMLASTREILGSVHPYKRTLGALGSPEEAGMLPSATRKMRGWDKIKSAIRPAKNWIAEAPLPRLGGIAAIGMAGVAALNLFSGDGTPQRPNDLPAYNNPTFEGDSFHKRVNYDMINAYSRSNNSNSLLSDSSVSLADSISSINSVVNQSGHNTITVRDDRSNPYMADMYNTFNH